MAKEMRKSHCPFRFVVFSIVLYSYKFKCSCFFHNRLKKLHENIKVKHFCVYFKTSLVTKTMGWLWLMASYVNYTSLLDCPSSKGNHAPSQKFERPNGKKTKSKIFLKSVQNLCPLSHLKAL